MSRPYLADRALLRRWVDAGDDKAAAWLTVFPAATHFGVDDAGIAEAFSNEAPALVWLRAVTASVRP